MHFITVYGVTANMGETGIQVYFDNYSPIRSSNTSILFVIKANSTATNTYTSSNISNTVTSASTGNITVTDNNITNTLYVTGVSNCKN